MLTHFPRQSAVFYRADLEGPWNTTTAPGGTWQGNVVAAGDIVTKIDTTISRDLGGVWNKYHKLSKVFPGKGCKVQYSDAAFNGSRNENQMIFLCTHDNGDQSGGSSGDTYSLVIDWHIRVWFTDD